MLHSGLVTITESFLPYKCLEPVCVLYLHCSPPSDTEFLLFVLDNSLSFVRDMEPENSLDWGRITALDLRDTYTIGAVNIGSWDDPARKLSLV